MQASARSLTLVDTVVPGSGLLRDAALVVGFAGLVALFAQLVIRLPFTPVPITGQTLAVLLAGGALGARRGAASLTVYALAGSLGLAVFAPTGAAIGDGLVHVVFPWKGTTAAVWDLASGGYIIGFIAAAYGVGYLAERGWDKGTRILIAMLLANILVYVPGLLWLAYKIGSFDDAMVFGLYPFIVGDLIKLYVAAIVLPGAWALVGRRKR